jgi:type III secretion system low calcium response chaperone LcrH/SycD
MDLFDINKEEPIEETKDFTTLSKEEQEQLVSGALDKMSQGNLTIKEALGMSPELLEQIYALAHGHYAQGNYREALLLFKMLTYTDPMNFNYLFGYASACHQSKDFHTSALAFANALQLEPENPAPAYYISDSLFHLDMIEEAKEGFNFTIQLCGDDEEHRIMKEQAMLLKSSLNK